MINHGQKILADTPSAMKARLWSRVVAPGVLALAALAVLVGVVVLTGTSLNF